MRLQIAAVSRIGALFALAVSLGTLDPRSSLADSNALWAIVHGACVPDEATFKHPQPCSLVDLAKGYAVLKDIRGDTQYLLIPTARVSGIESPRLLAPHTLNYFEDAWTARSFVEKSLGRALTRDEIGLAINSVYGRSQNQLHIHVDCVRADVRAQLGAHLNQIRRRWTPFATPLAGHRYLAMRVGGADLGSANPFRLLAEGVPGARANMGRETLVAIGASFHDGPGFVLLSDRAALVPPDPALGESLLDHACRVARAS